MTFPRWSTLVLAFLLISAIGGTWWYTHRESQAPSVAVLPFSGAGAAEGGSYFTDGFHDALITQLARVQGLTIISRASVLGYRDGPRDFARIGEELGVAHIVEGSIQRNGDHLHVTARLVAAASGRELWSAEYDRSLANLFSIQADIARQIARAIDARLTVEEEARLDRAPTKDLAAYDLYLRAVEVGQRSPPDKAALLQAIGWLEDALQRDPDFAQAHALLSTLHMTIYWAVGEYDKARLPTAYEHAKRAIELRHDLADAHVAMAVYWYQGHREYTKALESLGDARALEPNSAAVSFLAASIYRRLGRWDVSLTAAATAARLDPRSTRTLQVYVDVLSATRTFREAERVHASLAAIAPHSPLAFLMRLQNQERWTGGAGDAPADFTRFQPKEDPYCLSKLAQYDLLMLQRQYAQAGAAILSCPADAIGALHNVPSPKQQFAAIALHFAGDEAQAKAMAETARASLTQRLQERPDLPLSRIGLAYMLAVLGKQDGALAEAERALGDAPMAKDAIVGAELRDQVASLHAWLGQKDQALTELGESLELAYGSYAPLVQRSPFWESLQDDARFHKLLADHLPR